MKIVNESVCFVASTLPVGFMHSQFKSLNIKKIVVLSQHLEGSYRSFKLKDPSIEIVIVPSGVFLQSVFLLGELLAVKRRGGNVIIFHECCLILLDFLVLLVRPNGYLFPQVTLSGWEKIDFSQYRNRKHRLFLKTFRLVPKFDYYRSSAVHDKQENYAASLKKYPSGIISKPVRFSRDRLKKYYRNKGRSTKTILFVTGQSRVPNSSQLKIYHDLVEVAYSAGYSCYIKDHPNPAYRLGFSDDRAIIIDPLQPAELLERDYAWVIGVSSTVLLAFDENSISLLELLDEMKPEDRNFFKKYYDDTSPGNGIRYIKVIKEFEDYL